MMRVAVTGSTGRVGRVVAAHLAAWGYEVRGIDQRAPEYGRSPVHFKRADMGDLGQVYGALQGMDAVVHLAAIPAPGRDPNEVVFENNVMATYNVLEAAAGLGIQRVIVASSISALGTAYAPLYPGRRIPIHYFPLDEEHPLSPIDAYGLSKQVDELSCISFSGRTGMTTVALRYAWVTLPSDYPGVAARAGDPHGSVTGLWAYTDVRDVAQAIGRILVAPLSGFNAFYLTADDTMNTRPTLDLIREHYPEVTNIAPTLSGNMSVVSNTKAERLLGYKPRYHWRQYAGSNPERDPNENPSENVEDLA